MFFKEKIGLIYFIAPFLPVVKNKLALILSILLNRPYHNVKLKNGVSKKFKSSQYDIMLSFLGTVKYSSSFNINNNEELELSFDMKNKFTIPINDLTYENENLLELLYLGTKYGAYFIPEKESDLIKFGDKTFKIYEKDNKKIIETRDGIKFFIDSIHPGNTIVETFIKNIHMIDSSYEWNNKIVVDVGAECGDTPLYFAKKGAKVFAFEPVKTHFDAMIRNLQLNPTVSERITPINAAIGKDGLLTFYESTKPGGGFGASFVYNNQGKNFKLTKAKGYKLSSALSKFKISHVDFLKMDCKGCEFFLTREDLKTVDRIKIEYSVKRKEFKLEQLLKVLEDANFDYKIYRTNEKNSDSYQLSGNIYALKRGRI